MQLITIHEGTRIDDLGSCCGAGIGCAPAIGMEHGYDGEHAIAIPDRQRLGAERTQRMQHSRAVTVEYAFRIARGAGGVAERGCRVLVEVGPGEARLLDRQQGLVTERAWQARLGHLIFVAHQYESLDGGELSRDALDQRHEGQIEEQHAVFGMVGDIDDLLAEKSRVDGVANGTDAGYAEIDLKVAMGVPGDGCDAVTRLHTQALQGVG